MLDWALVEQPKKLSCRGWEGGGLEFGSKAENTQTSCVSSSLQQVQGPTSPSTGKQSGASDRKRKEPREKEKEREKNSCVIL